MKLFDTICAPITVRGESSVALIRISGNGALSAAEKIFLSQKPLSLYAGYRIVPGYLIRENGEKVDRCMAFVFRSPHSFTGEDIVELSFHGSAIITDMVMSMLLEYGVRAARPGEFTRRAFMNGKMSLTEAEAVIDIIEARTESVITRAEANNNGLLDAKLTEYTHALMEIFSSLNLAIDFDEEGMDHTDWENIEQQLCVIEKRLAQDIEDSVRMLREKRGIHVVISGRPNVGKSTLMNALLGQDRVLVSDVAGTTRDYVGEDIILSGHYVKVYDSAGLRDTDDVLESLGIEKAHRILQNADIVLYVCDSDNPYTVETVKAYETNGCSVIPIMNKCDDANVSVPQACIAVSARLNKNIDTVKARLTTVIEELTHIGEGNGLFMTERQYDYCVRVHKKVSEAVELCKIDRREEIISHSIRAAIEDLDVLSGKKITESMVESIFNRFCIGK